MASNFGELREVRLVLPEPYLRTPPKLLNSLGIPDKPYYRTADVCSVLGITPELFRSRLYTGKYPEFKRDGKGRLFSIEDLQMLIKLSQQLGKPAIEAVRSLFDSTNVRSLGTDQKA